MKDVQIFLARSYSNSSGLSPLVAILRVDDDTESVTINFSALNWIELGPMTYLLGVLKGWQEAGISVALTGIAPNSSPVSYMSRMDFFEHLGHPIAESTTRQDSGDRFVEFKEITGRASNTADLLADDIATCITGNTNEPDLFEWTDTPPENGYYDALAYSVSELIKNVQQHSGGSGYIAAQHYPKSGITQIAVVDTGMGIRESFERASPPHAAGIRSDMDALKKALEAEVSSKTHSSDAFRGAAENAGVGLTLLTDVAIQANGGYRLASGSALLHDQGEYSLSNDYKGTFVCLSFTRSELDQFRNLLENAKSKFLGDVDVNPDALEGIFEE